MKTIWTYLEKTASAYPDKIAVTDPEGSYTWQELVDTAKLAASRFAAADLKGKPVVVMMPKKRETVAVMMAVARRGGFYVFVDPEQPAERMGKIFGKLAAENVVTDEDHLPRLQELGFSGTIWYESEVLGGSAAGDQHVADPTAQVCAADAENAAAEEESEAGSAARTGTAAEGNAAAGEILCEPDDLLYGVFTSGSTGMPKGVVVSHRSVVDFIGHFTEIFGLNESDVIANQAPFDFDVSVKDIYSAIFTGAELVLIPKKYFSRPMELLDYLVDRKVTVLTWAVSALCLLSGMKGLEYKVPDRVRRVMFSGEVMPTKQLRLWQEALPEALFVNLYGPSEITCNCTYFKIDRVYGNSEDLPIGVPFPGRRVFLVGEDGNEVTETGVPGELCVAGESISAGYYHDPERTAEKFVTKLRDGQEELAYHTGDIAEMHEDGLLYFRGRVDSQIKHMGHRIELGEIEKAMTEQPEIDRACCIFDTKRNRIAGFYVGTIDTREVRLRLRAKLPVYMVPSKLYQIDAFPLNKNGKIDRQALMASV